MYARYVYVNTFMCYVYVRTLCVCVCTAACQIRMTMTRRHRQTIPTWAGKLTLLKIRTSLRLYCS